MASESAIQIKWGGSNESGISAGSSDTSDIATLSTGVIQATIVLKADNASTPSDGDTVDFTMRYTVGDPDGSSTDEYTTVEHSQTVRLDTFLEDPALLLLSIPVPVEGLRIFAQNNAGSNIITVSAQVYEQTA